MIILGNGVDDAVSAYLSQHDAIALGNGAEDTAGLYGGGNPFAIGSQYDTVTLGNGAETAWTSTPS